MRCKTCKHFARGGEYRRPCDIGGDHKRIPARLVTDETAKTGLCLHPAMRSDYVEDWTVGIDWEKDHERAAPVNGVCASCDEMRGFLSVGEDFGCIYHEPA